MKQTKILNLIGAHRIIRDIRKRAVHKEQMARAALRLRDKADNLSDYEYYKLRAILDHEVAEELELFADKYRVI